MEGKVMLAVHKFSLEQQGADGVRTYSGLATLSPAAG